MGKRARRRLVILGDSLALGREAAGIAEEDAYPALLQRNLRDWEVLSFPRASNRSDKQARRETLDRDISAHAPDAVLVQLGICDCAPRLFNRYESFVLSRLPKAVRTPIIAFFSKRRSFFTRRFRKVYVRKAAFGSHMRRIVSAIREAGAYAVIVGITDTNGRNALRSHGYVENIRDYNRVLREVARECGAAFLDVSGHGERILLADGVHLNAEGARLFADGAARILHERFPQDSAE